MSKGEIGDLLNTSIGEIDQELKKEVHTVSSQEYWKYDGTHAYIEWAIKGRDALIHIKNHNPKGQSEDHGITMTLLKIAEQKIPSFLKVIVYPPRLPEMEQHTLKVEDFTTIIADHPKFLKQICEHIADNWKI